MKTTIKLFCLLSMLLFSQIVFAQKSIREYVNKNDREKIKKNILLDGLSTPATGKSFKDGHGKGPYLSSKAQLPDTVALITFNINDLGLTTTFSNDYAVYTSYYSLTETGGNQVANAMLKQTIGTLKEEFKKHGVVLLTIDDFLDTQEKKDYYYNTFTPEVSKVGKFLSDIENRATDISVCADYYRYFDMGAAFDYKRSQSLGFDLANNLGVDGVLSIGVVIQSQIKDANVRGIKMALHAPNPIPKLDKKYYGQKSGTGYYSGQIYSGATLMFKKPITSIKLGKKQITSMNFDGLEVIFGSFIEKFYDVMNESIAKTSKN